MDNKTSNAVKCQNLKFGSEEEVNFSKRKLVVMVSVTDCVPKPDFCVYHLTQNIQSNFDSINRISIETLRLEPPDYPSRLSNITIHRTSVKTDRRKWTCHHFQAILCSRALPKVP